MKTVDFLNIVSPPEWMDDSACAEVGGDEWFPEKGGSTHAAKRICGCCSVRAECLAYALEHDERFGVWGGVSERERRRLKERAEAAAVVPPQRDDLLDELVELGYARKVGTP